MNSIPQPNKESRPNEILSASFAELIEADPRIANTMDISTIDTRKTVVRAGDVVLFEYEPPYDSPIEEQFAWHFSKILHSSIRLTKQNEVDTFMGTFRLDFLASGMNRKIGFECDGKGYHSFERDLFRDALILSNTDIDAIYRISGSAIFSRIEDVLFAFSKIEPDIFNQRGQLNSERLAGMNNRQFIISNYAEMVSCTFTERGFDDENSIISFHRLKNSYDDSGKVIENITDYCWNNRGLSLTTILKKAESDGFSYLSGRLGVPRI